MILGEYYDPRRYKIDVHASMNSIDDEQGPYKSSGYRSALNSRHHKIAHLMYSRSLNARDNIIDCEVKTQKTTGRLTREVVK